MPRSSHEHRNYCSGEDYILEFRSYRYGFNSVDFRQRVERSAVELDLVETGTLDDDELSDLVQLVASGSIEYCLSPLGEYIVERGDEVLTFRNECLIYWLRELIFRAAWADQRLLDGELEVTFDEVRGDFAYFPKGYRDRVVGPPPHPSWREVAYVKF